MADRSSWRERIVSLVAKLLRVPVIVGSGQRVRNAVAIDMAAGMVNPYADYEVEFHNPPQAGQFANFCASPQFMNGNTPFNTPAEGLLKQNLEVYQKGIRNG